MRLCSKRLTNKSIAILDSFANAFILSAELNDILVAFHQAKLTQYASKEGMKERWGSRTRKHDVLSFLMQVVNGMANKIDELNATISKMQKDEEKR
jgi:hypothetical protein